MFGRTNKLVCNKRKSVLSESILTVSSYSGGVVGKLTSLVSTKIDHIGGKSTYIEININSAETRQKVRIKRVSIITGSILMKFHCRLLQ